MTAKNVKRAVVAVISVWLLTTVARTIYTHIPVSHPDARIQVAGPEQFMVLSKDWEKEGVQKIKPLATYKIQGVVLSTSRYSESFDQAAVASSWDVALAWGTVADPRVLNEIKPRQYGRFVFWNGISPAAEKTLFPLLRASKETEKLNPREILERNIANIHVICDNSVSRKIKRLRKGQVITLHGDLVEVQFPGTSRTWKSSLTRDDTGNGACEIMHVRSISSP